MTARTSSAHGIALLLGLLLPCAAHARITSDPADPAFAAQPVSSLDSLSGRAPPLAFDVGPTIVTVAGGQSSHGPAVNCRGGDCSLYAYADRPLVVDLRPAASAVGLTVAFSDGAFTVLVESETGQHRYSSANLGLVRNAGFVGVADVGNIRQITIEQHAYTMSTDDWVVAPGSPSSGGRADLECKLTGPALLARGARANYRLVGTQRGPDRAEDAALTFFSTPALVPQIVDGVPTATRARALTTDRGDFASGDRRVHDIEIEASVALACDRPEILSAAFASRRTLDPDATNQLPLLSVRLDRALLPAQEDCTTPHIDDDCDGLFDCNDPDCIGAPACGFELASRSIPPGGGPRCAGPAVLEVGDMLVAAPGCYDETRVIRPNEPGCVVSRHGRWEDAPAWCCALPPPPQHPDRRRWVAECVPADPNVKRAQPETNGAGYAAITPGGRIHYEIEYENIGGADAHDVLVIDPLDDDLDLGSIVIEDDGVLDRETHVITWHDPLLPPHTARTVHFSAQMRADAVPGVEVVNVATIVFPDAVPPTRIDTPAVHHVIPFPARDRRPHLGIDRCERDAENQVWPLVTNRGVGFAHNVVATAVAAPDAPGLQGREIRFGHPTDTDPADGTVVPLATTRALDALGADVDCSKITWKLAYRTSDGVEQTIETGPKLAPRVDITGGCSCEVAVPVSLKIRLALIALFAALWRWRAHRA